MSVTVPEPPTSPWYVKVGTLLALCVAVSICAWAYHGAEIRVGELLGSSENMLEFLSAFTEPDFLDWRMFVGEMVVTLQIALWGTLLAVVLSVPFAFLVSSNITPAWVRQPLRRFMDILRSVNELIFAMVFISAVGLGPFAGVLAVFVHNVGVLAKLFSEAVEAIEPGPVEGIRATGAGRLEEITYGIVPQVMPLWISHVLYRFESNVRSSTVVGIVGAGGIGMLLYDAIRGFDYSRTAAIIIIIVAVVMILDLLSGAVRKRFI